MLVYLATPFNSHPDGSEQATKKAQRLTVAALRPGLHVFSPIVYGTLMRSLGVKLTDQEWLDFDIEILRGCDELWVWKLTGWDKSVGIATEVGFAKGRGIPIKYFPQNFDDY